MNIYIYTYIRRFNCTFLIPVLMKLIAVLQLSCDLCILCVIGKLCVTQMLHKCYTNSTSISPINCIYYVTAINANSDQLLGILSKILCTCKKIGN